MDRAARNQHVSRGGLWFGLFGGAIAWLAHLIFAYVIAEFGCVGQLAEHRFLNITLVAWLQLALTVATALLAGAATMAAYRGHRLLRSEKREQNAAERNVAWVGLVASSVFTFTILFESIPILYYLQSC